MRKVFLWLGVIVVSALVGFLGFYFAFYRPQGAELQTIQDQLVSAKSQIATQDAKYAELNSRLTALENAEFHSVLLDITTDIYAARLALSNEDVVAAKAALSNTAEKLASIQENLTAFDATVANSLSQRLGLIQSDLDHDTESAIADCDLMLNTLEDVETALFP